MNNLNGRQTTRYSNMTNEEFIAYLKNYMIDGCHPQICTEAAERLEKALTLGE